MHSDESERPVLRIVRGEPDDVELAALTATEAAVSAAAAAAQTEPEPTGWSLWADRSAALRHPAGRRPLRPGPAAWRTSALPL
ncbi:hypothetical protein GCM10009533_62290 [Saccharopolyspora spinosporotrichia]|uniref:Acyl-CoA carboxylase epsilon subunit-like protein n=1 Tax=Saccharopolyspora erythraea TaxID=1836 RepID=A0ABN1DZJ7_SACER